MSPFPRRSTLPPPEPDDPARRTASPNRRVAPPKLPEGAAPRADVSADVSADVAAAPPPPPSIPARASAFFAVARAIVGLALVIGVSCSVAWGARKYVLTTPRFAVTTLDVAGAHRRTNDDIAAEAGIAVGANVFTLDLEKARSRLLSDPWIREATLARRLPGTLVVQVVEREAAAIVALGDSYLATRDGEIFKRLEPGDPADLPIVTGLTELAVTEDRDGTAARVRRALDVAADYERAPLASRSPLEEVHLEPGGAVTLIVGKSALALRLGDPPYRRKLEQAARVIAEVDRRGGKPDAVMLDNESRPDRVVVRMR